LRRNDDAMKTDAGIKIFSKKVQALKNTRRKE